MAQRRRYLRPPKSDTAADRVTETAMKRRIPGLLTCPEATKTSAQPERRSLHRNWVPPTPFPRKRVCLPLGPKGERSNSVAPPHPQVLLQHLQLRGWGDPIRTIRRKPGTLYTRVYLTQLSRSWLS
jgi:hypothetical protein